jgi:hypothetical protein
MTSSRSSRIPRRAQRPGAADADPAPQKLPRSRETPARAAEDTDRAWGDQATGNDERLKNDVPPHWGDR